MDMSKRWNDEFFKTSEKSKQEREEYYGVETENKLVKRFRLYLQDGRVLNIPYAWLPIYELRGAGTLLIKTSDTRITIEGQNLDQIEDWLNSEKLLWIRENASGQNDGENEVFVLSIHLEGNLMQ